MGIWIFKSCVIISMLYRHKEKELWFDLLGVNRTRVKVALIISIPLNSMISVKLPNHTCNATHALQVVATWHLCSGTDMISSEVVTNKLLGDFSVPLLIIRFRIGSPYFKTWSSSTKIGCWLVLLDSVLSLVLTIFKTCPWKKEIWKTNATAI